MSDKVKIANKPYYITCSQPYVMGKDGKYKVNKFIDGQKSKKIVEEFDNRVQAEEFYNMCNDKWFVELVDLEGNIVGKAKIFNKQEDADEFYRQNLISNKAILRSEEDDEDDEIIKELESNFMDLGSKMIQASENNLPELDEEAEEELRKQKQEIRESEKVYDESASAAMGAAKELLKSVAELYLDKKVIEKYPYIKNRLYYEEQSISNITLQIIIANKVLKKYYKEIIKNPNAKNIETLGKLQKTILDISKYQRDYLGEIEKSFKQLKTDEESNQFVNDVEDIEAEEVLEEESGLITTNSRQKLIEELRNLHQESQQVYSRIPLSPNKNLQIDDDRLEDAAIINEGTDFDEEEGDMKVEGNGLDSGLMI